MKLIESAINFMRKKGYILFLGIFLLSCHNTQKTTKNTAQDFELKQIKTFATEQWDYVAKKIPAGKEELYGFQDQNEIAHATMGTPIRMFFWKENNIIESQIYRVPVMVEEKMVSLLTVSSGNEMSVEDFGGSVLIKVIQEISEKNGVKPYGILRVHSISSDFYIINENSNLSYILISPNQAERKKITFEELRKIIHK